MKNHLKFFLLTLGFFFSLSFVAHAESVEDLFRHQGDPVVGKPDGKVTVVEFFDYQCFYCIKMATVINNIISANPDVRFVFKDFPIRGVLSEYEARAAIAANKQQKYEKFNFALLTKIPSTQEEVLEIANTLDLNVEQLKKDMHSTSVKSQLDANIALAQEINLNGTPAFYIGKTAAKTGAEVTEYMGELSESELQDAIDRARR